MTIVDSQLHQITNMITISKKVDCVNSFNMSTFIILSRFVSGLLIINLHYDRSFDHIHG